MNKGTLLTKAAIRDPNKSIWKKVIQLLFYKNKNLGPGTWDKFNSINLYFGIFLLAV